MARSINQFTFVAVWGCFFCCVAGCASVRLPHSALGISVEAPALGDEVVTLSHADFESHGSRDERSNVVVRTISTPPMNQSGSEPNFAVTVAEAVTSQATLDGSPSWANDKAAFLGDFKCDIESLCTRENAIFLLAAGGVTMAFHESLDDDVAANTVRHTNRWGKAQDFVGGAGNPLHHLAASVGLYAYSLHEEDVELHELSQSLFSAVAITGVSTMLLKAAANTTRPNGESGGWPSGHTSSTMAVAAVLDEYYGHRVGIPAFLVAGLVGWERIDDREHDLSDVVFGAALGYVIGRSVASEHQTRFLGMSVEPFVDPATGTSGLGIERRY